MSDDDTARLAALQQMDAAARARMYADLRAWEARARAAEARVAAIAEALEVTPEMEAAGTTLLDFVREAKRLAIVSCDAEHRAALAEKLLRFEQGYRATERADKEAAEARVADLERQLAEERAAHERTRRERERARKELSTRGHLSACWAQYGRGDSCKCGLEAALADESEAKP